MEEQEIEKSTVKQISIKWGLIAGVFSITFFLFITLGGFTGNTAMGFLGLIPFIIFMYLAHKEFKSEGDGFMSYSKGLGIGTLMALVSAIISNIFTYVYIKFIDTAYFENMQGMMIEKFEEQGLSQDQIDSALQMTSKMQTAEITVGIGIVGGVFIGFIIALIVSAITKNANPAEEI